MSSLDPAVEHMFAERVSNPLEWFEHARALVGAARITKEQANVLISVNEKANLEDVCSMLYGLALENLFKATWINRKFGSPHFDTSHPVARFPKDLKTHDLVKLAKLIECELDEEEQMALKLLSDAVSWAGRYPCSLRGNEGTKIHLPYTHDYAEEFYARYRRPFTISR